VHELRWSTTVVVENRPDPAGGEVTAGGASVPARVDVAAALRHEQLAIRTIAVTFRAALRSAAGDPSVTREARETLRTRWRAWALDALARYAFTARGLPIHHDRELESRLAAVEAEYDAAIASVEDAPTD
jgi:hypothetical protein